MNNKTFLNSTNLTKELVVSRYNEDVSWTKNINAVDKITIYNKGDEINIPNIKLPNINREAHTYFYHIVNNYNNLYDITIFCQGNPFDHIIGGKFDNKTRQEEDKINRENLNEKIRAIVIPKTGYIPFLHYLEFEEFSAGYPIISTQTFSELFTTAEPNPIIINGAQHVVLKENILSKSLSFYQKNLNNLQVNKRSFDDTVFNPWSYESMWYYIFNKDINEKIG